jgi:hypothetical protein
MCCVEMPYIHLNIKSKKAGGELEYLSIICTGSAGGKLSRGMGSIVCAAWTTKSARRAAGLMWMYEVDDKCAAKACVLHEPGIPPWADSDPPAFKPDGPAIPPAARGLGTAPWGMLPVAPCVFMLFGSSAVIDIVQRCNVSSVREPVDTLAQTRRYLC